MASLGRNSKTRLTIQDYHLLVRTQKSLDYLRFNVMYPGFDEEHEAVKQLKSIIEGVSDLINGIFFKKYEFEISYLVSLIKSIDLLIRDLSIYGGTVKHESIYILSSIKEEFSNWLESVTEQL